MLKNTFMHVPGIGPATEQKLWDQGLVCWEDYLNTHEPFPLPPVLHRQTIEHLEESARALTVNHARHFETCLPAGEMWRLYREFGDKVAFLDIETTGLFAGPDAITVIGLFDGHKTMVFVQGHNLQEFRQEIKRYSLIVTFNGKRFDLPFIRYALGNLPDYQAHIDLLYPLRKLGYHGGLKSIEVQLGLERDGALKEADGFLAVLLWREYLRGNRAALDTLIRYNLEDVVNLQYLAEIAYNTALSRLPISLEPIPIHPKYELDVPFDPDLIHYLRRRSLYGHYHTY